MVNTSILLAIKDTIIAHDLKERLINMGYRVVGFATSNNETITSIEELNPDLVLTDIHLNKDGGGIKTGALIRSTFNKPVIYISGSIGQETIQRARSTGPFGYIFKPFDDKQIYAMVETALLRFKLEGDLRESRQWLNAVLGGINDGVIAIDNQKEIRFINPIAMQLTGWSEMQMVNKTIDDIFTIIDESTNERVDVFNTAQNLYQKNVDTRIAGLLLSRDGKTTPVEAELTSLEDGLGLSTGKVLVFRNIIRHQEAMQEIQRQRQIAEALVETAAHVNSQIELKNVLDTVCDICNQVLKAAATAIFLEDTTQPVFQISAMKTPLANLVKYSKLNYRIPRSIIDSLVSEDKPASILGDIQNGLNLLYLDIVREQDIHTVGIAGLYRNHNLIGVLVTIFIGDPIHLPEENLFLLKGLANQATISITNASLFEQVRSSREHQKALTTRLVEIQESERRHIAGELHDQIGQVLTGLQFSLESTKGQTGEALSNQIKEAQEIVSGLIEQIREITLNLRPSMLDDIGLLPTLVWHFERYAKQTGIKVSFNHNEITKRFSPEVETAIYRIIQEALTNIARHANVSEAAVRINLQAKVLGIEIIDHGIGFDPNIEKGKPSKAGLTGMRERANMLGGYLVVKSGQNEGTQIQVMLPLDQKPVERRNRDRNLTTG